MLKDAQILFYTQHYNFSLNKLVINAISSFSIIKKFLNYK